MQTIDLKRLTQESKSAEEVQRALDTIRLVEQLGGKRAEYNLAPPFSRLRPLAKGGRAAPKKAQ